jgi:Tfp pilus assembly protein PilV
MVKSKTVLIAAVIATAGIIAFIVFHYSDKAVIKRRFQYLAQQLAKESPENNLLSAAKAKHIGDMFADTCRVYLPDFDVDRIFTGRDVHPYVMMARSRYKAISIEFYDFNINIPNDGIALVDVNAFVRAVTTSGEVRREIHQLAFSLEKDETDWRFSEIESLSMLEK